MKTRFNTYDIVCGISDLQKYIGMRVNNIYDIDNRTYLIKLQRTEAKAVLLLESGNRFHATNYEWPKNMAPSGFSMKLRKHLKNKRLESVSQMGTDRIVNFQFGTSEAAYHVILELYDKGNIIFCDYEMTILNILRPHTEGEQVRFAVREKYPENRARESTLPSKPDLQQLIKSAKNGDSLKKLLIPHCDFGPPLIEHVLLQNGFTNAKIDGQIDVEKLYTALLLAAEILSTAKTSPTKGYIIQRKEQRPKTNSNLENEYFYSNQEFHPFLYAQCETAHFLQFDSFNQAVDEFFSTLEAQKSDLKALQQERDAIKKLENVKKDHVSRVRALEMHQESDQMKAELITRNQQLVDQAIVAMQGAIASQISWSDISTMVKDAAAKGEPIAKHIKHLKLSTNHITMLLSDPYYDDDANSAPCVLIDIDLALTAFANARRYYDQKRHAAKKQQKTIESTGKALKSAEKKTKQILKEVQTTTTINKARKVYWFEKFFWFVSSENYLVIGGRDQQQNEMIVKRYMKPIDVYVHADIHGAASIIIKNPTGKPVPPKTLNEAGTMAICYSVAWDAKVLSNAYWVLGDQVSKTAPTGEYLTTGSFMIRGKKNFLPPSQLILGLGFLFRLEDGSVERHKGERKVVTSLEDEEGKFEEEEIVISDDDGEEETVPKPELEDIKEEEVEEESSKFPDTKIKIMHFQGTTKIDIDSENRLNEENKVDVEKPKLRSRNASETSTKSKVSASVMKCADVKEKAQWPKRGHKGKLKKIKEKYKDQDDEERELRMTILQSAGPANKKSSKKDSKTNSQVASKAKVEAAQKPRPKEATGEEVHGEEEPTVQADVDMIDALTGLPVEEDELLFAVPVVAPYNTLSHYKYKIKLTPGTSKRGKAAKTAVNIFVHDKTASQRERDLLKAVKDETLARNIPGKVKLSAPRLQTSRQSKVSGSHKATKQN